jgi:hypothetical protein
VNEHEVHVPREPQNQIATIVLECLECETSSEACAGWRAYLGPDDQVLVYCGDCAERELGDE